MHPLYELTMLRLRTFWRETGAVFWTFGFPLALTVVLGVAFRERPREELPVGLAGTCRHAEALAGDASFKLIAFADEARARAALRSGRISLALLQDCTYAFDPDRPQSRLARALVNDALQRAAGRRDPLEVRELPLTEPGARYVDFLVPGLIGSNIMSSGMWGIGFVIVEMRNKRLIKRLVATPMRRGHFLASFVLMRLIFLVLELAVLLAFGTLVFGVPIRGSLALICGLSLLGSLSFSGLGLLVSSRATNMPTINGLINAVIMPMFLGSGVFFSTSKFPEAIQPLLKILPLTALNDSLRAVMLDGATVSQVLPQSALLLVTAVVSFAIALKVFRWR
jgi:ABC-2 type transport system permease protein